MYTFYSFSVFTRAAERTASTQEAARLPKLRLPAQLQAEAVIGPKKWKFGGFRFNVERVWFGSDSVSVSAHSYAETRNHARHPGSGPERATGRLVMMSSSLGFTLCTRPNRRKRPPRQDLQHPTSPTCV